MNINRAIQDAIEQQNQFILDSINRYSQDKVVTIEVLKDIFEKSTQNIKDYNHNINQEN